MPTVLGFDYGTRKIGIAVGQTITGTANPLVTLRTNDRKPDWDHIEKLIKEWRPEALIVGLPLDLDDAECEIVPMVKRFSRQLEGRFQLPVHLADERLTSREAQSRSGHKVKHKDELDAIAAQLIIETWMMEAGYG